MNYLLAAMLVYLVWQWRTVIGFYGYLFSPGSDKWLDWIDW